MTREWEKFKQVAILVGLLMTPNAAQGDDPLYENVRRRFMATPRWSGLPEVLVHLTEAYAGGVEFDIEQADGVTISQIGGTGPKPTPRSFQIRLSVQGLDQTVDCSRVGHKPRRLYEFIVVAADGGLICMSRQLGTMQRDDCPSGQIQLVVTGATENNATVAAICDPGTSGVWPTFERRRRQPILPAPTEAIVHDGMLVFDWNGATVRCPAKNGYHILTAGGCEPNDQ